MIRINLSEELRDNSYIQEVLEGMVDRHLPPPSDFPLTLIRTNPSQFKWQPPRRVQIPKSSGGLRDIFVFDDECSFFLKILNAIFVRNFGLKINSSVFSYRKGLRCFDAVENIRKEFLAGNLVGYKFDIKSYFPSVNQNTIYQAINDLVEENDVAGRKLLYSLFDLNCFIDSKSKEIIQQHLGLMPGSALSSFFANYVLHDLDDFLQQNAVAYSRYADDIVIFAETDEQLQNLIQQTSNILADKGLIIHPNKQEFLHKDEPFEFLGLIVSPHSIDISNSTFKNIKRVVKSVCKSARRKVDKQSNLEEKVTTAIRRIHRKLFYGIFSQSEAHKGSRMNYVFGNVTTDKTLKELDHYILDSLNFVVTGKHNFSKKRWTRDKFKELGLRSCVEMWHLYRMNREVYKNEVFTLNKPPLQEFPFIPRKEVKLPSKQELRKRNYNSFVNLFADLLKDTNSLILLADEQVPPECLTFDIMSHQIRFQDLLLAEGNELKQHRFTIFLKGKWFKCFIKSNQVAVNLPRQSCQDLLDKFLPASYDQDFSASLERAHSGFTKMNLWRTFSFNELLARFSEEQLQVGKPLLLRKIEFASYLFFRIVSKALWDDLDSSKHFICVGDRHLNFVLKREWLF